VVFALLVGGEFAPQVVGLLVLWVLEIVLSVCTRLPDINDRAWNALLGVEIHDHTVHKRSLAIWVGVANDGVAEVAEWGVRRPEGSQNCGGGRDFARLVDMLVRDLVD
jgi:hypothetical protein